MSSRADAVITDRLPAITRTDRLPAVPAPRTVAATTARSRRRSTAIELPPGGQLLAEFLERITRTEHASIAVIDQRIAAALSVPVIEAAAHTARLRAAADTYAAHPAHDQPCTAHTPCDPQWVCDHHLAPLQDWWDARDLAVRALLTFPVPEPPPPKS